MSNRSRLFCSVVPLLVGSLAPISLHAQWIEGGTVPVCVAPGQQTQPEAVPDGFGSVVVAWLDCRNGCSSIYAQGLDPLESGPDLAGETSLNVYAERIKTSGAVAVTDGVFSDNEQVAASVFDSGDRPPVLEPIASITISVGSPVVVEAIASDPDTDAITYAMPDPRFSQSGNVFRWQSAAADTGIHYFAVVASDGYLSDTTTVKVTVLPARFYYFGHDAMDGEAGSWFDWGTNATLWSSDLDGYLSGSTALDNWSSSAVSRRGYDASSNPTVNFRIEYDQSGSQYMLGFTPTGADGTDFNSSNVTLGLRVHVGNFKPSWDLNTNWGRPIPSGVVDIRITLLKGAGKIRFQAQHVAGFDSPLSTFNDPDWSMEVARPIGDLYYVQAAPVNSDGRIYDVWGAPEAPGPVLHVTGELSARENSPAIIEASADHAGNWPIFYWISDARFARADSVFTWQTHVGDAGIYRPVVLVSDGYSTDSATVKVTVMWEFDPPGWTGNGTPVCTATGVQEGSQIVSDGYGGTIIAWVDRRYGNADVFAQRLNADGIPQWAPNGVPICTDAAEQSNIDMVSDGNHGAVIAWLSGTKDIVAQRINSDGNVMWNLNGINVRYAHHTSYDAWLTEPHLALNSGGGVYVACSEGYMVQQYGAIWYEAGITSVSPSGTLRWDNTWEKVLEGLRSVRIAADPFGGVILCYANLMDGFDVVHRVASNGSTLWSGTFMQGTPCIASDGAGGAIICAAGLSGSKDIWAQRFTPSGQAAWTASGIPICTASGAQSLIDLESSGADRFTVAWLDMRSSTAIYAQSIDTSGTILWQADGIRVNSTHGVGEAQCMAPDGAGGAFIGWWDGTLYAQHVTSAGALLWGAGADVLRTGAYSTGRIAMARAEECGVVAAWSDNRNGEMDIFANSKSTVPCNHPPVLAAIGNKHADVGAALTIQLAVSDPDPGDTHTYATNAGSVLPSAFSFDANTGLFSWTPLSGEAGDYAVTFSVTDGVYVDRETIVISVFENGTRPPTIEPIADVTVYAGATARIEAHASDPDGDPLVYSISDARFTQNGSVFSWQTTAADTGTYHFIVSVTDGHLSESTAVTVRVLRRPVSSAFHDSMTGPAGPPFEWSENGVVWHPEEAGYLSGTTTASWSNAVVSGRALNASVDSQVVFRLQFVQGATNYIVGFSQTPPSSTDFDRTKVVLGLYLHSGGTLRPSWSVDTSPWAYTVSSGVVDVRVTLHKDRQTVSFDLENVASYGNPVSTFLSPDWSAEISRPVEDTYYIQINPYSSAAKVYDVWLGGHCGGPVLQPIDDVVVWEEETVAITAHATSGCWRPLAYSISDHRFSQNDSVFVWHTQSGDGGEHHPVLYVTDGVTIDSVTVSVTVLRTATGGVYSFSSMAVGTGLPYGWHSNNVVWSSQEDGYLSGPTAAGWFSGVVSGASWVTTEERTVEVRFLRLGVTNIKAGFTFTPPRVTDYDSRKIDCGMYIDSTGSVYPTAAPGNHGAWTTGLHDGIYDLRIDIDKSRSTVTRSLVRVPRFDDPLPDFSTVVFSVTETMAIADTCWIQINPYSSAARIYQVTSSPVIVPEVASSASAMRGRNVYVSWTLSREVKGVRFYVSRQEMSGIFDDLPWVSIENDSLTYAFEDTTCKPGTPYRYLVETDYPTGRVALFYESIKTPAVPLALLQNHPNPFGALTTIAYDVPSEDRVTIDVYNVLGQHVARLVDAKKTGGRHTIDWNGTDDRGRRVSSGMYFYRVSWAGQTLSRKMILLK